MGLPQTYNNSNIIHRGCNFYGFGGSAFKYIFKYVVKAGKEINAGKGFEAVDGYNKSVQRLGAN